MDLDDESLWDSLSEDKEQDFEMEIMTAVRKCRLSCFAHTLQLCVGDGLKCCKGIRPAMSKASRLSTLVHTSTVFAEEFSKRYGEGRSIPAANQTRLSSVFHQIQTITFLDHQILSDLCEETKHCEVILTVREWGQLRELVEILQPFAEATLITQGEALPTISLVLPTVLSLCRHLRMSISKIKHLRVMVNELDESLKKRFAGIFSNVLMSSKYSSDFFDIGNNLPFGDSVYVLAACMDPSFGFQWLIDVNAQSNEKCFLKDKVKELIITEAESISISPGNRSDSASAGSDDENCQATTSKLFSNYKKRSHDGRLKSATLQLSCYCDMTEEKQADCLSFWSTNKSKLNLLYLLAMSVLAIPASSAPVERVFSRGGLMLRPHRSQLTGKLLSDMIFLKCNISSMEEL